MKRFLTLAGICSATALLGACASNEISTADEAQTAAPYAEERTVGTIPVYRAPERVNNAEPVFERRQRK